ncbi:hypothetical protein M0638_18935 [Roseomonas sp. NAR14]|uniref:YXWGXW repeat-containing protein n=1 Tax=Roseomonas acroporae TaxID=2937791 RepID=A0A9X1YCF8_9PROT|nr:hypothetical protein [Roseomonas acroporae]MCK8786455.1 hypothetical protein [Roseomonas acroporae]
MLCLARTPIAFRAAALLATFGLAACVPPPGPAQTQAQSAAIACQQGNQQACAAWQQMAPAAQFEQQQQAQQAQVGTAVAAGAAGLVAGAAIANSNNRRYYRWHDNRGWHGGWYRSPPRGWHGPPPRSNWNRGHPGWNNRGPHRGPPPSRGPSRRW